MSEMERLKWGQLYRDLAEAQTRTLALAGDIKGAEMFRLLGDVRKEAERIAPPGWSPADEGLLPLVREEAKK